MADITIIMPSYNKEKYIAEALDSVFMQKTVYDYQIIVADDGSTDRTVEIVNKYQQKYPNKIILLNSDKNLKLYKNILRAYEITKTDYFCVLDPDDYWIDEFKIQKALDFLEKNKDYTIYVTDTDLILPNGDKKKFIKRNRIVDSTFKDFLLNKASLGCTLGSTFRNVVFKNGLPEKMKNLVSSTQEQSFRGDSFRSVIHLFEGKAHCVPEVDALYRVTDDGLWQGSSILVQNLINANLFKDLWLYFDKKYPELLIKSHKFYLNCKNTPNLFKALNSEDKKIVPFVQQMANLETLFECNKALIKSKFKVTIRYKILFFLLKKIKEKLAKAGLI